MKHAWLLRVLACVSVASGAEPTKPSRATPDFERLLSLHREFGLPVPPPDAPIARVPGRWAGEWTLGFVLKPAQGEEPAEILVGPFRTSASPTGKAEPPQLIATENVDTTKVSFEWHTPFPANLGPVLAVQFFQRGHTELAEKLLAASAGVRDAGGPDAVSAGGPWRPHRAPAASLGGSGDSPEVRLGGAAWSFWLNELMKSGTDWKAAHVMMRRIVSAVPELNDEPKKALLSSLAAALEPRASKPGSVEAAIDDLVDCNRRFGQIAADDETDTAYDKLLLLGFTTVPGLIEHLDDRRLTRSVMVGFNNFPTMPRRVGELASDLIGDLIGEGERDDWLNRQLGRTRDKASVQHWWKTAQGVGEETYLRSHVLPRAGDARWPHLPHLRIIAHRYPQRLPEIYRELLDHRPELQSWPVAEAIEGSALPPEEKRRLFTDGATRQNPALRRPALRQLRTIDPAAADTILLPILRNLPTESTGSVWTSDVAKVSHLVMESGSDEVWTAFAAAVKRAHVSLRLELMNPLNYTYTGGRQFAERVHLLSQFLDDPTERIIQDGDKRYDGPCAAFTFPRITVRDFAAMQLASLLKLDDEPEKDWSPEKWTAFRHKVRAALAKRGG